MKGAPLRRAWSYPGVGHAERKDSAYRFVKA